jgi:acyl-CoA thioesterase FadM
VGKVHRGADSGIQNHVNNVTYIRYAESARVNWAYNYAVHIDPRNRMKWSELCTPRGNGLILRSMRTDYKFVSLDFPYQLSC